MFNDIFIMKEICFLFCILCFYMVSCDEIKVDLSSYRPSNKTSNVYKKFTKLTDDDTTKIKIKNINADIGFLILQIHSYIENITLSYNSTTVRNSYITGTNIGLVYGYGATSATFYLFRNIRVDQKAPILLIITVYDERDPLPGGCNNLNFGPAVAPYQLISYNEHYITVESQAPSAYGISCNDNKVQVEMYHLFLNEYDNNIETYFDGINKMITVDDIKLYGRKVPENKGYFKYNKLYSSYRGTGEVFAIIATYNNRSSSYIPALSYGCDLNNWNQSCLGPVTDHWKVICAALLIFGLFVCFFGHKFFRFTLFTIGVTFGVLVTYFAVSFDGHFSANEKTITSLIIGFFYGIIWVFIWWKFGVPILSAHLNFLLAGILAASVIFYTGLADLSIYHSEINFWITFIVILLACLIIWTPATMHGHIFGCSFLGSYAFITALNYYLGGNMQYIVINTFRRATVEYFNNAIIDPPFQIVDVVYTIAWVILVVTGVYIQLRGQRGKPPFPPHRNEGVLGTTERTPLIPSEFVAVPQYIPYV